MNQKDLITFVVETNTKCLNILEKKNNDYADPELDAFQNFRSSNVVGVEPGRAILVRTMDKLARLSNLINKTSHSVEDEKLSDTVMDAINYLHILYAYLEHGRE